MTGGEHVRGAPAVRRLARLAATVVYRDIDIHVPAGHGAEGPVLAVANHFGGLADGVLLIDAAPRRPRVVARDVIWKVPLVGRMATGAGMIPVHRSADRGARTSNDRMFASAYDSLADGDLMLIFPEGVTQDDPHMAEVRTGAARIALGARESGVSGIAIQPVGLHYEDKAGFRSRALVHVGEPMDLDAWVADRGRPVVGGADDRQAVRALTGAINARLRHVAPDFPDWDQARALGAVAETLLTDVDPAPPAQRYGDVELLACRLNRVPEPARGELVAAGTAYRRALRAADTSDRAVATAQRPVRSWDWVRDLVLLVLLLPFALVGLAAAIVPLLLVVLASRLRIAPAVRASVVPGLATLLLLVEWVLLSVEMGADGDLELGLATAVLFPFMVAALIFVAERTTVLWRRWLRRRHPEAAELADLQLLRAAVTDRGWAVL